MKVLSWIDPSSYGDLAEGDDKRCASSNRDEQPHVQCALGYRATVIVVVFLLVGGNAHTSWRVPNPECMPPVSVNPSIQLPKCSIAPGPKHARFNTELSCERRGAPNPMERRYVAAR